MKTLLIAGTILLTSVVTAFADPSPFERVEGLGVDRENLTPQMLNERFFQLMKSSEFGLMRHPIMEDAPSRVFNDRIWPAIEYASYVHGVPAAFVAAVGMVESQFRNNVQSPTGPKGWGQFTTTRGAECGLIEYGYSYRPTGKYRKVGRGKNRRRVPILRKTYGIVRDDRYDELASIWAVARCLSQSYATYGSWDFAIQEHHSGNGRVRRMIMHYLGLEPGDVTNENVARLIRENNLTYAKVYFENTPYFRRDLYLYLEEIKKEADFAPNYSPRVLQAAFVLTDAFEDRSSYDRLFQTYVNRFNLDRHAPARMWIFYTPEQLQELRFADLLKIREASESGRLVKLPEPWTDYGFDIRLHGTSSIGNGDPSNQLDYIQAEPSTVGCLILITHELKRLQEKRNKPFIAYEINNLVKIDNYDKDKQKTPAFHELPTHELGKAFDFTARDLSGYRLEDLMFILSDMDTNGMISYMVDRKAERYKKGRKWHTRTVIDAIHVVPHPLWEGRFLTIYRQATGQAPEETAN